MWRLQGNHQLCPQNLTNLLVISRAVFYKLTCKDHTVNNLHLLSVVCVTQRFPEHDHKELIKNLNQKYMETLRGVYTDTKKKTEPYNGKTKGQDPRARIFGRMS